MNKYKSLSAAGVRRGAIHLLKDEFGLNFKVIIAPCYPQSHGTHCLWWTLQDMEMFAVFPQITDLGCLMRPDYILIFLS